MDRLTKDSYVYVDTNIFIYFVESAPGVFQSADALFQAIAGVGAKIATSELTIAECIYLPAQQKNAKLISLYERLFEQSGDVSLIPLTGQIAKSAGFHGGALGLKLMDAIHYMSALEAGCDVFATADAQFKSGPKMRVLRIAS